jgi:hypothetical protein
MTGPSTPSRPSSAAKPDPAGDAPRNEDFVTSWLIITMSGSRYVVALDHTGVWWFTARNVPNPFSCPVPPQLWRIEHPAPWPPVLGAPLWLGAALDLSFTDSARVPGGGKNTSAVEIVEQLPIRTALERCERAPMATSPFPGDDLDDLLFFIIPGELCAPPSVAEQPSCELTRWRIVECRGNRHFLGLILALGEGRVSSAIRTLDLEGRHGVTASGRRYRLDGPPGRDPDADYVLDLWLRGQGITPDEVRDVTADLFPPQTPQTSTETG